LLSFIRCVAKFFPNFQRASLACFASLATLLAAPLQAAEFPSAVLAIVVDDVGYNLAQAERLLKAPGKLTLGILPFAPHSPAIARRAQIAGKEVILHQPMEPIATPYSRSERGTLTMQMSAEHFNQHFADALAAVPYAVGVNNHTGSLLTQHREPMSRLMRKMRARGLFFLDSRTTAQTVALSTARDWQVPAIRRDVFLDHALDRKSMNHEFDRALRIARRQGHAVLIAHPHRLSLDVLEERMASLPSDIQLTTLGDLVKARLNPLDRTMLARRETPRFLHRSLGQ